MINISITDEQLQMIQTALVFTACTEACYKGNRQDQIALAELSHELHDNYGYGPEDKVYLFELIEPDNTQVFQILEKFTNKKQR